jgi:hypothetical protein
LFLFLLLQNCPFFGFLYICFHIFFYAYWSLLRRSLHLDRPAFKQFLIYGPQRVVEQFPDGVMILSNVHQDLAFLHEPLGFNFFLAEAEKEEIEYCRFEVFIGEVPLELFM